MLIFDMNVRKGIHFQRFIYGLLRIVVGPFFCLFTNHSADRQKPHNKTFLLLANHTCDYDPIYAVCDTKSHMKFVASANLTRGFGGFFIKHLAGPIPREKGASADSVVEAIKECLENDISVAMYPEGITTWCGETEFISKRTAQLVKESKGGLVTYATIGGYLKHPRWAVFRRSGKTYSRIVAEYDREYLDTLSVDEIYEIIRKDLYVNAYNEQEQRHWKYKSKALAEGLEGVLYVCPTCGKLGSLKTKGDDIFCGCGKRFTMDVEGWLNCGDEKISILNWSRWQKKYLKDHARIIRTDIKAPLLVSGNIRAYGDRIEVGDDKYYYDDISKMSIFRATRLFFTHKDKHYEFYLDPKEGRVGQAFFALWRICTGREYY